MKEAMSIAADHRNKARRYDAVILASLIAGVGYAAPSLATQTRVDGVLTTCKSTASPNADVLQGALGNLKADYQQLLTSAGTSGYPSTGSCNVCHGTGSTKGGDAATNRSEASKSNYAFFCAAANAAPTLTLNPATDQAITEATTKTVKATSTDPNNDPVTIAVTPSPLPSGATFDGTTLSYTPPLGTAATTPKVTFTFQATDKPASGTALASPKQTISFNVTAPNQPTNTPPVVGASTWAVTVGDATTYAFDVSATDVDGDPLTLTAKNLPTGVTFTPDAADSSIGHLSWAPNGPSAAGNYAATITASDGTAQSSGTLTINVSAAPTTPGTGSVTAVKIGKAYWSKRTSTLLIAGRIVAAKGTTVAGLTVTIKDATSGAALGTAKVNARGGWGLAVKAPATIPCLVSATVDSKTASHYVDRAPSCHRDDEDDDEREEHRSASSKTRGTVGKK
jgi:hypothetical protein